MLNKQLIQHIYRAVVNIILLFPYVNLPEGKWFLKARSLCTSSFGHDLATVDKIWTVYILFFHEIYRCHFEMTARALVFENESASPYHVETQRSMSMNWTIDQKKYTLQFSFLAPMSPVSDLKQLVLYNHSTNHQSRQYIKN